MKTTFEQFVTVKQEYNEENLIALMRQGDFYTTYKDDAKVLADITGVILHQKEIDGERIYTSAIPFSKLDIVLPKLIRAGKRVAICENFNH